MDILLKPPQPLMGLFLETTVVPGKGPGKAHGDSLASGVFKCSSNRSSKRLPGDKGTTAFIPRNRTHTAMYNCMHPLLDI